MLEETSLNLARVCTQELPRGLTIASSLANVNLHFFLLLIVGEEETQGSFGWSNDQIVMRQISKRKRPNLITYMC